jgi:NAD(P)-dependent dehydrogenase (short-subunit alcohol dehydrogenase family)
MAGDLSIASDVAAVADQTLSEFGDVDILVHNAGIASRGLAVRETTRDELERVMSVHALAPHDLTARLLPAMRKAERSDVIFISSAEVGAMHANGAPYNMGKSAMEALAFTLAKEEATHGVRVNIIAPGLVITDMGNRLVKSMTGEGSEQLDEQNLFPFRRACRPEDIATAVTAVLSPSFAYMTGQRIGIDGGVADINQVLRIQSPQH